MSKEQSPNSSNISNEGETVEQAAVRIYPFPFTPEKIAFIKGAKWKATASNKMIVELIEGRIKELTPNAEIDKHGDEAAIVEELTDLLKTIQERK